MTQPQRYYLQKYAQQSERILYSVRQGYFTFQSKQTLMSDQQSPNQRVTMKEKQEAQRKYGCPCGKWYLSYPALFTHVKQKHEGKAPGSLIKPKTDKARGRPRLPTTNVEQDPSIINFDCLQQIQRALHNKSINYNETYEFSEGHQTCQDMASQFLNVLGQGEQKKIVVCFINYIKFCVGKKYDNNYWETHKPTDIIDISNQIVRNLDGNKERFPIDKQTLIELLYLLFRWMYKEKWTDHKLVRRTSEQDKESNKQNKN